MFPNHDQWTTDSNIAIKNAANRIKEAYIERLTQANVSIPIYWLN